MCGGGSQWGPSGGGYTVPVPRSGRVPAGCRALPLAYDGIPRPYFESQMDEAMVGAISRRAPAPRSPVAGERLS